MLEAPETIRNVHGQFQKGSKGQGQTHSTKAIASKVRHFRTVIMAATEDQDIVEVWMALLDAAKKGDMDAIKEFFLRTLGKPVEADLMDTMEALEEAVSRIENGRQTGQPVLECPGEEAETEAEQTPVRQLADGSGGQGEDQTGVSGG